MAPGPPDKFGNNKFSILGDFIDIPSKKKKSNEFPELPSPCVNSRNNPKYVLITSSDPKKQLSQISPFAIKKGVESISTEFDSISLLRDGNLLILTRNSRVADRFLRSKFLSNVCPITCKLHESLNSVKGVIYAPCLINVAIKEIVEEMKDQGVIDIYKFTKPSEDGKSRVPTGKMVITFDLYRLPKTVDVAWYKCKVDFYIPNPMRCTNCQKLGHTKNHCKGDPTCSTCSLPPHASEDCTRIFCTNCSGDHPSADKNCPRFLQMKEVLKYKTENYCSIGEARRKLKENNQLPTTNSLITYASTVNETPTKRKETTSILPNKINKQSASISAQRKPPTKIQPEEITTSISELQQPRLTETTQSKTNSTNHIKITENIKTTSNLEITNTNFINTPGNNNNNKSMSPISNLTQSLITDNNYFIPSTVEEILEDTTMHSLHPLE